MQTITYSVPGISCGHCRTAINQRSTRLQQGDTRYKPHYKG